ncbi:MAG TPA: zinc-dependent metalloprotease, partial [Flavisolibacter sp.]
DIIWYHNHLRSYRNRYMLETGAANPKARTLNTNMEDLGEMMKYVITHEIGHALGLPHNMKASAAYPTDSLRSATFTNKNGIAATIMDYARFNYVAQPEDKITDKGMFPRIGDYDMWAIEWGYRWMPEHRTAQAEVPVLNKKTMEKLKDKRLWFGTEIDPDDPRGQNEDLGDNAMKASAYGIKNLQRIVTNLPEWTKEADKDYRGLQQMYGQLTTQFQRYMGHVAKNIGGIQTTPRMQEEAGIVVEFTPKARQKEAMQFLQTQLFKTPTWLKQSKIEGLIGTNSMNTIIGVQNNILGRLMSNNTFNKLFRYEASGQPNVYSATEMLSDLRKGIWSELSARKAIDIYRRNLQKAFVEQLVGNLKSDGTSMAATAARAGFGIASDYSRTTDAMSIAKAQLRTLQSEIRSAMPAYKDAASRAHLQDVNDRITEVLEPK